MNEQHNSLCGLGLMIGVGDIFDIPGGNAPSYPDGEGMSTETTVVAKPGV